MRTKMTVTVYNPVGAVASTAVMVLTADEAARLVSEARENGVRCEVTKFEAKTFYTVRVTRAIRVTHEIEVEAKNRNEAAELAKLVAEDRGDVNAMTEVSHWNANVRVGFIR